MTFKEIKEKYNLKLTEISRKFGIPYSTVQRWWLGSSEPPEYTVNMIQRILELENEASQK